MLLLKVFYSYTLILLQYKALNMRGVSLLNELPPPPSNKRGWPWTEETDPEIYEDMNEWPKITLVTPNYNQGMFIEEAIRSVLLQNYPNLEYLIFDAKSTDNSVQVIKMYERWITYWESEKDRGQSHAINKGLVLATGTYFNWQNADDILLPGSLKRTVEEAVKCKDLVYLNRGLLFSNQKACKSFSTKVTHLDKAQLFKKLKPGYQPGGLMLTKAIKDIGYIDENLKSSMDYDLQLRLLLFGEGYYLEEPGIIFRVHADQKTEQLLDDRRKERFIIYRKIYKLMPKDSPYLALRIHSYINACMFGRQMAEQLERRELVYYYSIQIKFMGYYMRVNNKINKIVNTI